ncbi:MAG: hypothetical protein AABW86_02520 [Candidatus Micrarchaeota archaeon]
MVLAPFSPTAVKECAGKVIRIAPRLATHLPEPAVERVSLSERAFGRTVFQPIQRYAKYLNGETALPVEIGDVKKALGHLSTAETLSESNMLEPLIKYLRDIIRHTAEHKFGALLPLARKALLNLNAIQVLQDESAAVNSFQSLSL